MNASMTNYDEVQVEYKVKHSSSSDSSTRKSSNKFSYGRSRGKHPSSANGIHRRRSKRIRW